MKLVFAIIVLMTFHQAGEWFIRITTWPIPGAVVGMLLLLISLLLIKGLPNVVESGAEFLLKYFSLFFVPAGVGIMLLFGLIANEWLAMLISLVLSTFISLICTGKLLQWLLQLKPVSRDDD